MGLALVKTEFNAIAANDPLYQVEQDVRMGAVNEAQIGVIETLYPDQADFARALIPALNFHLNPPLPILASLVVLRRQLQAGNFGVMAPMQAVRMPLSILSDVNGRLQRFLTPVIALARQSWLTFNMAMKNRPLVQDVCTAYGIQYLTTCCCSLLVTHAGMGEEVLNSTIVRKQDYVRSAADRLAAPVNLVSSLDQIEGLNADLTSHEVDSFNRIEALLDQMAQTPTPISEDSIRTALKELRVLSNGIN